MSTNLPLSGSLFQTAVLQAWSVALLVHAYNFPDPTELLQIYTSQAGREMSPPEPSKELAQENRFTAKAAACDTSNLLRELALWSPTGRRLLLEGLFRLTSACNHYNGPHWEGWITHIGCVWFRSAFEAALVWTRKSSALMLLSRGDADLGWVLVLPCGGMVLVLWAASAGGDAKRSKILHPSVICAALALFLNGLLQIFSCCQVPYLQDKKLNASESS